MMDYRLDPLWLKLATMNLQGAEAMAPFMKHFEQQMGWSRDQAGRMIEEYRKFLFLAMRAGHQVVPPGPVNEVWMTHLQGAQDYWEQLGKMIAERPVAGAGPFGAMADPWKQTLESYEKIFGTKPPMDIWSGPAAASGNPWEQWMQGMRKMFGMG